MKARGLLIGGLLMTALFTAFHMEYLNEIILQLPEDIQTMLAVWILQGKSIDWQIASVFVTIVGLFSITIKKKEEF